MPRAKIDQLIINSPYEEPKAHWKYNRNDQTFEKVEGRRDASFFVADPKDAFNEEGGYPVPIKLVNQIRPRVKAWKEANYPGVTGVTRKLLAHWYNNEQRLENKRLFFCQLDAMETLIWLAEAPAADKNGIDIKGDGGPFSRICTKLCTGGGKTTVMAMLIAWQVCNKVSYPQDKRYSKNVFIVAPGLTVKSRLQVLNTGGDNNYYSEFGIVPSEMTEKLHQGKVIITNWQALSWDTVDDLAKKHTVDKRGPKSDEAYAREVLGPLANAQNILVINDEAHHAWRTNFAAQDSSGLSRDEIKEATVWVSGLDRIHAARKILTCYDFSATPFVPSGKKNDEETLYNWIVSDFGLNDGIESGLVKTPRVVVRDDVTPTTTADGENFRSKLYHIYSDEKVKSDINRAVPPAAPLPALIIQAYNLLGADWLEAYKNWTAINPETKEPASKVPPVLITVANRIETAARIKYAFEHNQIIVEELCDTNYLRQIDSKTVEQTAILRDTIDTVGQIGKRGEQIRNVISVGMLTEGWDAKTVTHILGLRAFSSQLLCEQVVGRGLRRKSYDIDEETGLFRPEYVNIFGIPFTFLPHEGGDDGPPIPPKPKTTIQSLPERAEYEIIWPNIQRIFRELDPKLHIDFAKVPPLTLDVNETRISAELAPILNGKTDLQRCTDIDLKKYDDQFRMQKIIFETSARVFEQADSEWKNKATPYALIGQIFSFVEKYIKSRRIIIEPVLFTNPDNGPGTDAESGGRGSPPSDELRVRIVYMLNMNTIVTHLWDYIMYEQTEKIVPIFGPNKKTRSTADMKPWHTTKKCWPTKKSQISHCVFDSGWENTEHYKLEKNEHVLAFAKNDHLGFGIHYSYLGIDHTYYPDFLILLDNGKTLVLEVKGQYNDQAKAKRKALAEWIEAVNTIGSYGQWCSDISFIYSDVDGVIERNLK